VLPDRGYDTRKRSSGRNDAFTSAEKAKKPESGGRTSSEFFIPNLEAKNFPPYNNAVLNYIWLGLILIAVVLGGAAGALDKVTAAAFKACQTSVMDLALPLAGIMALWLGMMRLAEKSGLVELLARALRPLMRRLFPDVPPEHPAMGSMLMNMAANMLGLANAATPLGLRAMQDLETLNKRPGTATNAMCTFLAINTSSIQLVPATTVAYMAAAGAVMPTAIIGPAFLATVCSTIAGVTAVKLLEKLPGYRLPPVEPVAIDPGNIIQDNGATASQGIAPSPLPKWAIPIMALFFGFFVWLAFRFVTDAAPADWKATLITIVGAISVLAVPFLLSFFPLFAALKRIPVYEEFVEGAKEGFQVAIRIIPYLVAILVAVAMVRAAFEAAAKFDWFSWFTRGIQGGLNSVGFPPDLLPLALMRPLSGSGSNGIFNELIREVGPDSTIARMAGTIMGSTETTFYVIAVYFGSVAVRRTRHAVPAGLIADLTGIIAAIIICRLVFGS
jgi:spore maturation protein SpmA/spore maturation protein SpmB